MGITKQWDFTTEYKQNVYNLVIDVGGWQKTTITLEQPAAALSIYGTNDSGAVLGETYGNAGLAINFNPIKATDLSSNTAANTLPSDGNYEVDINTRFIKLQGADVYKLLFNHYK